MIKYFEDEKFTDPNSINSSLEEIEFINCEFIGLELSEFSLRSSKFIECKFEKCNLSNSSVINASFRDVIFNNCKLLGINWSTVQSFYDFKATSSILDYCIFSGIELQNSTFKECAIRNAEFTETNLKGSTFDFCDFNGTQFHHSNLEESDFRAANNYYIDITKNKVRGARFSMPDAIGLFHPLGIIVE